MSTYYADDSLTLLVGDAQTVLAGLPAASVDCVVTSPPYFGLRDYNGHPEQIGLEDTPACYVNHLVGVFAELRRVLADDGTVWLNLGDSYYSGRGNPGPNSADPKNPARRGWVRPVDRCGVEWAQPKNLLGIPWRVAFALQDDGWYLRNDIIWHKPNAMPESVTDRLSCRYEHLFLLTQSRRYFFDLDAIREPLAYPEALDGARVFGGKNKALGGGTGATERRRGHNVYGAPPGRVDPKNGGPGPHHEQAHPKGRNPGDMWSIATRPLSEAHFATFPVDLPRRCILAGCKPGGVVLDPFSGSGTTALAAQQVGRTAIGIDLNAEYHDIALRRMPTGALPFGEAS